MSNREQEESDASVLSELQALRQRVAELEQALPRAVRQGESFYRSMLDSLPHGVYWLDCRGRCVFANKALLGMVKRTQEEMLGTTSADFFPPEAAAKHHANNLRVAETGETIEYDDVRRLPSGEELHLRLIKTPTRDEHGVITGIQCLFWDVTTSRLAERQAAELARQAAALRELSTPLIPIADRVLVMPLIGAMDEGRARQVLEALLEGVAAHRATVAILDVTGVREIDSSVANGLIRAAHAVKLLGAEVVLTGTSPSLAQALTGIGVDLGGLMARGTLQDGIAYAMRKGA